jgi:hypothetical protein
MAAQAPDVARIYVCRPGTFGFALAMPVDIDGTFKGSLGPKTYLALDVPPGPHRLTSRTNESVSALPVTAVAGEAVYVELVVRAGMTQGRSELRAMDLKAGKAAVENLKRVETE